MGFFSGLGAALAVANPVALGANLLGGGLDWIGAEKDRAAQEAMNASNNAEARLLNQSSVQMAQAQMDMQRDFAQNGISWRIADAARNGISPLAALGVSTPSASPVSAQLFQANNQAPRPGASFRALSDMSQNISRSILATKSPAERTSEVLSLQRQKRENDLLDVQYRLALINLAKQGSPSEGIPSAGQSVMNRDGTTSWVPSHGGEFLGPLKWSWHNQLMPALQSGARYISRRPSVIDRHPELSFP